jgi:hypothetical protein
MRKKKRYEPNHDHDSIGEDEKNHLRVLDALTDPELCEELRQKTCAATGLTPREFQLRAAIALWRNRDLILHAGTGSGKSLSFVMPCFLSKTVTVVIISPLNALMDDQASLLYQFIFGIHQVNNLFQARRFREWGLRATSVNAATLQANGNLLKVSSWPFVLFTLTSYQDIQDGLYQVVITSPENSLKSTHLKPFLTQQKTSRRLKIIVDEAHVIKTWGSAGFRLAYLSLGHIRAFVLEGVPFAACSATMAAATIDSIKKTLHFHPDNHEFVNIGNFRPNIVWEVHHLTGKTVDTAVNEIGPFLPPLSTDSPNIPLTIIFVNDRSVGQLVFNYVRNITPSHLKDQVHFMFALKSHRGKSWILYETMIKARGILICTEIAALVRRVFYWLLNFKSI